MGDTLQQFIHELETTTRFRNERRRIRAAHKDKEKKLLALHRELSSLYTQRQNARWIVLDPPIRNGYVRSFIVRPDIQRSKYGPFFEGILKKINTVQYSDKKDFKKKARKRGRKIRVPKEQHLLRPDEAHFRKLGFTEREKQLFIQKSKYKPQRRMTIRYYEFADPWRFVLRVRPHYITHQRVIDPVLESKIQQLNRLFKQEQLFARIRKASGKWKGYRWFDFGNRLHKPPRHNRPLHCTLAELKNDLNPASWQS